MTTKHVANTAVQNHVGGDDSNKAPLWQFLGIAFLHLYFELDSLAKKERKQIKLRVNLTLSIIYYNFSFSIDILIIS